MTIIIITNVVLVYIAITVIGSIAISNHYFVNLQAAWTLILNLSGFLPHHKLVPDLQSIVSTSSFIPYTDYLFQIFQSYEVIHRFCHIIYQEPTSYLC